MHRSQQTSQPWCAMYGLEYALFFGVPENKIELIDGRSYWSFPSQSREAAESQFEDWIQTICRWKQFDVRPVVQKSDQSWRTVVAGIEVELFPRPISLK